MTRSARRRSAPGSSPPSAARSPTSEPGSAKADGGQGGPAGRGAVVAVPRGGHRTRPGDLHQGTGAVRRRRGCPHRRAGPLGLEQPRARGGAGRRPDGRAVGATLGNDVNLRDFEGRSALLLGEAKDNNASCAIGPLIRLFDDAFTLDDVAAADVSLRIEGADDGFELTATSSMSQMSRTLPELLAHTRGAHHQYPDGFALFTGTMFAPTKDRDAPGMGFTHHEGDVVTISTPLLGTLINTVTSSEAAPPWEVGIRALWRESGRPRPAARSVDARRRTEVDRFPRAAATMIRISPATASRAPTSPTPSGQQQVPEPDRRADRELPRRSLAADGERLAPVESERPLRIPGGPTVAGAAGPCPASARSRRPSASVTSHTAARQVLRVL